MDAITVLQTVLAALQSGQVALNASDVFGSHQANATAPTPTAVSLTPFQLPVLVSHLLSLSIVRDWLKLLLIGAFLELFRRVFRRSRIHVNNYFWISATLDENDDCGIWLMFWLSKHKLFRTARTLDVSTRTFGIETPEVQEPDTSNDISQGRRVSFLPSVGTTYTLWYKYRYLMVTRSQANDGPWHTTQKLSITMLTRDHEILRGLLLEAKKLYYNESKNLISIYVASSTDTWKTTSTQHKRPMRSIILDPGVIELVLNDARDFLASKDWYSERGIPHRRGYLLYGAPGAGKTSLIHGIAGELSLDVYILSLTRMGMDDASLNSTIAELPERCIVLIEDIDAAFHRGIKRDIVDPEKSASHELEDPDRPPQPKEGTDIATRITLSGLLNALDGIGAQEGRILFATTNDYKALDAALCRPGRLDLHIEFKLASKYQCRELFRRFYLPSSSEDDTQPGEAADGADEKDSGYGSSHAESVESDRSDASPPAPSVDSNASATVHGLTHPGRVPRLTRRKAAELADQFAAAIPDRSLSMATLQGYLMLYKTRPYDAVADLPAWVKKKLFEKQAGTRSDAPELVADVCAVSSSSVVPMPTPEAHSCQQA